MQECICQLKGLATTLAYHISTTLRVPLSERKMFAAANSRDLLIKVKSELGFLAGTTSWAPGNLGVAYTTGRHQKVCAARVIRRKRLVKFVHRHKRLGTMKLPRKVKARLFKAG
eukprot:5597947-Pyramimonas_sp.AAC.1